MILRYVTYTSIDTATTKKGLRNILTKEIKAELINDERICGENEVWLDLSKKCN